MLLFEVDKRTDSTDSKSDNSFGIQAKNGDPRRKFYETEFHNDLHDLSQSRTNPEDTHPTGVSFMCGSQGTSERNHFRVLVGVVGG